MVFQQLKIIWPVCCACLFACTNHTAPESAGTVNKVGGSTVHAGATDTIVTGGTPLVLNGCYEMVIKQDTATLVLQVKDTTVTGRLNYHWYEKDWNEGSIKGVLRGDKIYADYTFQSEGLTSVREVIFKIKDTTLLQGNGPLTEQGGKIVYRDKNDVSFNETYPFIKIACK